MLSCHGRHSQRHSHVLSLFLLLFLFLFLRPLTLTLTLTWGLFVADLRLRVDTYHRLYRWIGGGGDDGDLAHVRDQKGWDLKHVWGERVARSDAYQYEESERLVYQRVL